MGRLTISMAIFNSYGNVYQRVDGGFVNCHCQKGTLLFAEICLVLFRGWQPPDLPFLKDTTSTAIPFLWL